MFPFQELASVTWDGEKKKAEKKISRARHKTFWHRHVAKVTSGSDSTMRQLLILFVLSRIMFVDVYRASEIFHLSRLKLALCWPFSLLTLQILDQLHNLVRHISIDGFVLQSNSRVSLRCLMAIEITARACVYSSSMIQSKWNLISTKRGAPRGWELLNNRE